VLTADFGFDWQTDKKEMIRVWIWGPAVRGRLDKFIAEVDRHPDWSETKILAALRDGGARFGPDQMPAFLQALPIEKLEPFTGELVVQSSESTCASRNQIGLKPT
jgi:hypothetical protein